VSPQEILLPPRFRALSHSIPKTAFPTKPFGIQGVDCSTVFLTSSRVYLLVVLLVMVPLVDFTLQHCRF
jgi:hypothetical protein